MTNRFRLVNALAFVALAALADREHSSWVALLALVAAWRLAPQWLRFPIVALVAISLARMFNANPFNEGQALLSDFVFPFTLLFAGLMMRPQAGSRFWPVSTAAAGALFLIGGAAHDNMLTGEVAAALCVTAGQWRR